MNSALRQLESVAMRNGAIDLKWRDNSHSRFHPIWLRDNCRCAECGDPAIGYRNLQLTSLDLNLVPRNLAHTRDQLKITWEDGHQSCYAASWQTSTRGNAMNGVDLIVTIPHQAGAQYMPAFPHRDPIDTTARGIIHPIILQQQQALHIAEDYARPGQAVEPNINVACKLRAGW